jgi:hypothetical protein
MNTGYLIYQAERTIAGSEQREVDITTGELAASLARRLHSLAAPLRFLRRAWIGQQGSRAAAARRCAS